MKRLITILALAIVCLGACFMAGCAPTQDAAEDAESSSAARAASAEVEQAADELRIGSLKGPTSVGLAPMMADDQGVFTVAATADEIAPQLLQDELDIVLVPANLAATLYQKTDGQIRVLDVNTLGVLYAVTSADISSVEDLKGRVVYMTGKGTVPEYTVRALLEAAGIQDEVDIQFKSEPTEVVALITQEPEAVGILPQPYATSATMKVDSLEQRIDLTEAWEELTQGDRGTLITGVTIAKADTVDENRAVIDEFIARHQASVALVQSDPASVAAEVVDLGIIDDLAIAEAAIPRCNVVCITGAEMAQSLSRYLEVLEQQDPAAIGGELPGDDFYLQ